MVDIDASARRHDGVTLVTATVTGGPVPTRVRVENRLDGPVWPPRRAGEPVAGWDERGFEGIVPADETLALGYATPGAPDDEPLELVVAERASENEEEFDSAAAVLRGLGSPAPPREALALPDAEEGTSDEGAATSPDAHSGEHSTNGHVPPEERAGDARPSSEEGDAGREAADAATTRTAESADATADLPESVAAWFEEVAGRVEAVEALAEAEDVPSATAALADVGSLSAAEGLDQRRADDAERLRAVARRANALAYRAEEAAVPLETLERLA